MKNIKVTLIVSGLLIFFGIILMIYVEEEWNPFGELKYYPTQNHPDWLSEKYWVPTLEYSRPLLPLGVLFFIIGIGVLIGGSYYYHFKEKIHKNDEQCLREKKI